MFSIKMNQIVNVTRMIWTPKNYLPDTTSLHERTYSKGRNGQRAISLYFGQDTVTLCAMQCFFQGILHRKGAILCRHCNYFAQIGGSSGKEKSQEISWDLQQDFSVYNCKIQHWWTMGDLCITNNTVLAKRRQREREREFCLQEITRPFLLLHNWPE